MKKYLINQQEVPGDFFDKAILNEINMQVRQQVQPIIDQLTQLTIENAMHVIYRDGDDFVINNTRFKVGSNNG